MTFTLFKFLHIITMFSAVSAAVVTEIVLHRVASSGNVPAIRVFSAIAAGIGKILPILFVGGAIFGLIAAFTGSIDFFQPWLIGAYIVFIIAMLTGALVSGPWAVRMATASAASEDGSPSAELVAAIHDQRARIASTVLMSAIVVLIFLMVFKPGN